jgi:hypothetical protein
MPPLRLSRNAVDSSLGGRQKGERRRFRPVNATAPQIEAGDQQLGLPDITGMASAVILCTSIRHQVLLISWMKSISFID